MDPMGSFNYLAMWPKILIISDNSNGTPALSDNCSSRAGLSVPIQAHFGRAAPTDTQGAVVQKCKNTKWFDEGKIPHLCGVMHGVSLHSNCKMA